MLSRDFGDEEISISLSVDHGVSKQARCTLSLPTLSARLVLSPLQEGGDEWEDEGGDAAEVRRPRRISSAHRLGAEARCLLHTCVTAGRPKAADGEEGENEPEDVTVFFDVTVSKSNDRSLTCAHASIVSMFSCAPSYRSQCCCTALSAPRTASIWTS